MAFKGLIGVKSHGCRLFPNTSIMSYGNRSDNSFRSSILSLIAAGSWFLFPLDQERGEQ